MNNEKLLQTLKQDIENCSGCKLATTRERFVFGEGNPLAKVMLIGEAPGKNEDLQGRPFVGRSGELLNSIIEQSLALKREDLYISNIVKCRPTVELKGQRDRPPEKDELNACCWIIEKQIEIIKPLVIITLGNPSTKFILKTKNGITKIRGSFFEYKGIKVMPTYHPSYVIRNGGHKSPLKADIQADFEKVLSYIKSGE